MVYETKFPRQHSASTVTEDCSDDSEVRPQHCSDEEWVWPISLPSALVVCGFWVSVGVSVILSSGGTNQSRSFTKSIKVFRGLAWLDEAL